MNFHDPRGAAAPNLGNDAVGPLSPEQRDAMVQEAATHVQALLNCLAVDTGSCHNTRGTALRHARMLVCETLSGRYSDPPVLTDFDNPKHYSDLIVTGPIDVRSTCAHHLMPIYGEAYVGVLPAPDGRIVGLSKFDRVVDHFASRLQIQEELTRQVADYLLDQTASLGVAVRVSAVHMCKTHRGVRSPRSSRMVTTVALGRMAETALRAEFLAECAIRERADR